MVVTVEEKKLREEKQELEEQIKTLLKKNAELETEAVNFDNLVRTLDFEPFVELKNLVSRAIQDKAKDYEFKACEKPLKNGKAIEELTTLLEDYQDQALQNRDNIESNKEEISKIEDRINEIDGQLRQGKLSL